MKLVEARARLKHALWGLCRCASPMPRGINIPRTDIRAQTRPEQGKMEKKEKTQKVRKVQRKGNRANSCITNARSMPNFDALCAPSQAECVALPGHSVDELIWRIFNAKYFDHLFHCQTYRQVLFTDRLLLLCSGQANVSSPKKKTRRPGGHSSGSCRRDEDLSTAASNRV